MIEPIEAFWSLPVDQLYSRLDATANGLTTSEADHRLRALADSRLVSRRRTRLAILLDQFNSPIIWLLLTSSILSFYLEDHTNGGIILFILVASGLLGFWQEFSADDAVAKLLAGIESHTTLIRDGNEVQEPADKVVTGDVVVLTAGALIPGDCRILDSKDLFVDEAALTGESFPVEKDAAVLGGETVLARIIHDLPMKRPPEA